MINLQFINHSVPKSIIYKDRINYLKPSKTEEKYRFIGNISNTGKTKDKYYHLITDYYAFCNPMGARSYSSGVYLFGFSTNDSGDLLTKDSNLSCFGSSMENWEKNRMEKITVGGIFVNQ